MKNPTKWLVSALLMVLPLISLSANNASTIAIHNADHQLIAPDGGNYQWFYNGECIEGADAQNFDPSESGTYTVSYTNESNNVMKQSIAVHVEEDEIIRIFIIGDSTVSNYGAGDYPFAGWGQVLKYFFDANKISTHNRARGGRSSRSFYEEGLWTKVTSEIDSGDYVFVQFGHNDRDYSNEDRYTSPEDFKTYMRIYVNESREKGAIPVLVSPMNMNTGTRNVFTESGSNYRGAMLEVAEELNVPFIDLNTKSYDFYQEIGTSYASYFVHMGLEPGEYPNYSDGYSDTWTHYQEMGALAMARMITEEIKKQGSEAELVTLANLLTPLYPISVTLNNTELGLATLSSEYPEGATVTLKARLNEENDVLKYWVDSIENIKLEGSLVTFTMEPRTYEFTGFVTDCYGTVNGSATIDECGVCTGGESGIDPCADQIPFIEFCQTNMNNQIILEEELYSLLVNPDTAGNAYISQPLNVDVSNNYMFALQYNNQTANQSLNIYVDDQLTISDLKLETGEDWKTAEFSVYLEAGNHTLKIENILQTGLLLDYFSLYSDAVTPSECTNDPEEKEGAFVQSDSLIVIEAENYTGLKASQNGENWISAMMDNSSSGSVVIAPAETSYGASGTAESKAPVIRYKVAFSHTGNYAVWARVYAFNGSSDSYHLGLNNEVLVEKIDLYNSTNTYEEFTWMHVSDKKLNVSSTGVHSLDVFCREPNLIVDKIILSLDATYNPRGEGPEQTFDAQGDIQTAIENPTINSQQQLLSVYPNPAQNQIQLKYNLVESSAVKINIINTKGQTVANLVNSVQSGGAHEIIWNMNSASLGMMPDGLYLVRFQSANATEVQKLLIRR